MGLSALARWSGLLGLVAAVGCRGGQATPPVAAVAVAPVSAPPSPRPAPSLSLAPAPSPPPPVLIASAPVPSLVPRNVAAAVALGAESQDVEVRAVVARLDGAGVLLSDPAPASGAQLAVLGIDAAAVGWRVGDGVFARGPWRAGPAAAIDCRDISRCAVGLLRGGDVRYRRADLHQAASFLAQLHRVNVFIVGGNPDPLTFELRGDAPTAFAALAAAGGLSMRHSGRTYFLGDADRLRGLDGNGSVGRGTLSGGVGSIDLKFHHVPANDLLRPLQQVARVSIVGGIPGSLSMWVRNLRVRDVLRHVVLLSGEEPQLRGDVLTIGPRASLPAAPEESVHPCPIDPLDETVIHLRCVPPKELEVCAVGGYRDGHPAALVRRATPGPGEGLTRLVRPGDFIGTPPSHRVTYIDDEGVEMEGRLYLSMEE